MYIIIIIIIRLGILFEVVVHRIVAAPHRLSLLNVKSNIKLLFKASEIRNPLKLLSMSLIMLELSRIILKEGIPKLLENMFSFDISHNTYPLPSDSSPLNVLFKSAIYNIMFIITLNPLNIIKTRLIVQEMTMLDKKFDGRNDDDKEKSSRTHETISNIRKRKYKGIFDCVYNIYKCVLSLVINMLCLYFKI